MKLLSLALVIMVCSMTFFIGCSEAVVNGISAGLNGANAGFAQAAAANGETTAGPYVGMGQRHWVNSVSGQGAIIALEDGSVWRVQNLDQLKAVLWLPTQGIAVGSDTHNVDFPYVLVNTATNQAIAAAHVR